MSQFADKILEKETEEKETEEEKREKVKIRESVLEEYCLNHLSSIEEKLHIPNYGGRQVTVKTGRIDILAEDKEGVPVVIELKSGTATTDVLGQIYPYVSAIKQEELSLRGIVIAEGFSEELKLVARTYPIPELVKYKVKCIFNRTVEQLNDR